MKKFFLFLTLLTLSVGQMLGADATFSWTSGGTMGSNATGKQGNITLSGAANSASNAPGVTSNTLRIYAYRSTGNGASATFTADDGYQITAITVTSSNGGSILKYSVDGGSYTTFTWISGSSTISNLTASAITLKNCQNSGKSNTTIQVASVVVTYESTGGGCDKSVILAQSVSNGTATFTPAGPVATCSATASDRQVSVYITPTTGYALTSGPTVSGVASATISGSGPYTIQLPQNGNGTLTLNATCSAIAVTGVSLNKNSTSIVEGSTETLTATIAPSNALDQAVTWSSNATEVATVNSSGVVTAKASGEATITVTTHEGSFSASCTVTVTAAPKDHFIDEVHSSVVADKTSAYNFSSVTIGDKSAKTSGSCEEQHYHFVGWITKEKYDAGTSISNSDIQTGNKTPNNSTYYAVWAKQGEGGGTTTETDELTYSGIGLGIASSGNATYTAFTNKSFSTDAVYAGQICKFVNSSNPKTVIQMRSNNSNSGIVTTTSGGTAEKVTVDWHSNTGANKVLQIYGKNTAYSAATDLYDNSKQGTLIGTITKGTSTELTLTGNYQYIGLRSSDGTLYFNEISIDWAVSGGISYTDYIAKCCSSLGQINGSFFWSTLFEPLSPDKFRSHVLLCNHLFSSSHHRIPPHLIYTMYISRDFGFF